MTDREKAIRILEGNYKNFVLRHNGELLTVNELIKLLKAQEPRVMALEEVRENHDVVYLEDLYPNSKIMRGPYLIDHNESDKEQCTIVISYEEAHIRFYCDYGKTWRCWTSRPDQ